MSAAALRVTPSGSVEEDEVNDELEVGVVTAAAVGSVVEVDDEVEADGVDASGVAAAVKFVAVDD